MNNDESCRGLRCIGHTDLGDGGDGMQVMLKDDVLFVGRMTPGRGITLVDVSRPSRPRPLGALPAYPDTWQTKCQVSDDLLIVNYEQRDRLNPDGRTGYSVFDISNPRRPRELVYVNTGGRGIHRLWWDGERHAYLSGQVEGYRGKVLLVVDMHNPGRPETVGVWAWPGLAEGEDEEAAFAGGLIRELHHGIPAGGRLYCGLWDAGFGLLDMTDPGRPALVAHVSWAPAEGRCTHTALPLPGRPLVAVLDESTQERCDEPPKYVRLLDVSRPDAPRVVSRWRVEDEAYCRKGGRFGPHNFHENRRGTFRSDSYLYVTYFNAGLRVLDVRRPERPVEVAHYVPSPPGGGVIQTNDVLVTADGIIYITDRAGGGVHVLAHEPGWDRV